MNMVVLAFFAHVGTPQIPPQNNIFSKLNFFICFTIAQSFWNNFCFWVKCIFLPQKGNFPKNMDFCAFFGNINIMKVHQIWGPFALRKTKSISIFAFLSNTYTHRDIKKPCPEFLKWNIENSTHLTQLGLS